MKKVSLFIYYILFTTIYKIKYLTISIIICFIIIISNSCKKDYTIDYQYVLPITKKFIFMPGSQWIYKSDTGIVYDTVKCIGLKKDTLIQEFTTYKGDNVRVLNEYYVMITKHSFNKKIEANYFYLTINYMNVNTQNNIIRGQPIVAFRYHESDTIEYVGSGTYRHIDTSITINSTIYATQHSKIIATQQSYPYYNYDTDLYFKEEIGLVRIQDLYSGWSLQTYNVSLVN